MRVAIKVTRHLLDHWAQDKPFGFAITACGNEYQVGPNRHGQRRAEEVVVNMPNQWNRQRYADYCTKLGEYVCGGCMATLPIPSTDSPQIVEKSDVRTAGTRSTIPQSGSPQHPGRTEDTDGNAPPEPQW
jgi:hypothetical protein